MSNPADAFKREITLKSTKTRGKKKTIREREGGVKLSNLLHFSFLFIFFYLLGTQKTNKTNKTNSSIYRSKFDYSLQNLDSRNTYSSI